MVRYGLRYVRGVESGDTKSTITGLCVAVEVVCLFIVCVLMVLIVRECLMGSGGPGECFGLLGA